MSGNRTVMYLCVVGFDFAWDSTIFRLLDFGNVATVWHLSLSLYYYSIQQADCMWSVQFLIVAIVTIAIRNYEISSM